MSQIFILNDNTRVKHMVDKIISHDNGNKITTQFSRVIHYYIDMVPQYRYIYEEIDNNTDSVIYARYMGKDNIEKNYPWAREILS